MARLSFWSRSLPLLLTVSLAAAGPALAQGGAAAANETRTGRAHAEQLTVDLARSNLRLRVATSGERPALEASVRAEAQTRAQVLRELMQSDPGEVLRLRLPAEVRASLPPGIQAYVEEEADEEGTLEVLHEDRDDGHRNHYHLHTAAGLRTLHFAADPPQLETGSRVRARGIRLGDAMALGGSTNVQSLSAVLSNTFGAQKTLVILVNFYDKATQPYTLAHARTITFDTTSSWDVENSYGQTWLVGDVVGWYTIPLSAAVCDPARLRDLARQAASGRGVNITAYARHVFAFPQNACAWWGLGTVGGTPSSAWINGTYSLRVLGHEMGHNFGLYHSHSLDCGADVLGPSCGISDYGDTLDIMGGAAYHFAAFHKERLGWLGYGSSPGIATVTAGGTYKLDPYSTVGGVKALKILKNTDSVTGHRTNYYLEYRQPAGFDAGLSTNANVRGGVVIRLGTEGDGNSSYLLDMTPQTASWQDPALGVGQSYHDGERGVTIIPAWATSVNAGVTITFATPQCAPGPPGITISPSESQWVAAGTTVVYTVSVKNNDSSACSPATFALAAQPPSGWTAVPSTASVTVAPGATVTAKVSVTSSASAAGGFYPVGISATDSGTESRTVSAVATYVVTSAVGVSVVTDRASYVGGQTITVTSTVKGSSAPVAGARVTVTIVRSNGSRWSQTVTTGTTGVAVVKLLVTRLDPGGTWRATATASLNGAVIGTGTTTFTVAGKTTTFTGAGKVKGYALDRAGEPLRAPAVSATSWPR